VKEHHWTTWRSSITSSRDAGSPSTRRISCTSTTATCGTGRSSGRAVRPAGHHQCREGKQASSRKRWPGCGRCCGVRCRRSTSAPLRGPVPLRLHGPLLAARAGAFRLLPAGARDRSVGAVPAGVIKLQDVPLDSLNLMQRMQTEYFLDRKSHADPAKVGVPQEGPVSGMLPRLRDVRLGNPAVRRDAAVPAVRSNTPCTASTRKGAARHFEYLAQPGVDPGKRSRKSCWARSPRGRA